MFEAATHHFELCSLPCRLSLCRFYFEQYSKIFGAQGWCNSCDEFRALMENGFLFAAPGGIDDDFMLGLVTSYAMYVQQKVEPH